MQQLTAELLRAAHVDQRLILLQMRQHVITEGADTVISALFGGVAAPWELWNILCQLALFVNPFLAPAIHQFGVLMPEEAKYPECISCPPVILVPIKDNGRIVANPVTLHQLLELLSAEIVASHGIVKICNPVD